MPKAKLNNGFKSEYIGAILPRDDKIVVFSRGDLKYLCLSEYDLNGSAMSFYKTEVGNYGIWNVVKLGDGYIFYLRDGLVKVELGVGIGKRKYDKRQVLAKKDAERRIEREFRERQNQ